MAGVIRFQRAAERTETADDAAFFFGTAPREGGKTFSDLNNIKRGSLTLFQRRRQRRQRFLVFLRPFKNRMTRQSPLATSSSLVMGKYALRTYCSTIRCVL